ncbi:flagellar basal-body rod protein FlgG [Xylophilus sp. ASV27]|uniref:flagellar basal-body rod protein FlgG n=1 Tax=Xylophilus sp. ASV27 TaxID=2795129 RepID=UPI0018EB38D8|nr:flagellar basal-body rod protein FlgG [Xylophilus sp. ASV27]
MFDALYIGATGMQAQQLNVDTIANNLANVNTTGFKKGRVNFSDLMVRDASRLMSNADGEVDLLAPFARAGMGVGIAGVSKMFDLGDLKQTGSAYDLTIQGDGFLEVLMPDGSSAYTRGGTLKINADGQLATQAGHPLKPSVTVPDGTQKLTITSSGRVQATVAGQANASEIGQLELVRFANTQGLSAQGDGLYRATDASGAAITAKAGEDGVGTLAQGVLEGSNVKMVDEMVNLMVAQRIYEANAKLVQASDEMTGMANGLRK